MKNSDKPAYPVECEWSNGIISGGIQTGNHTGFEIGLTKREMFVMAAMQGLCSNSFFASKTDGNDYCDSIIASRSIEIADELLKHLKA
jgi:hypothetical protein